MSFTGHYQLLLTCDAPSCDQRDVQETGYSAQHSHEQAEKAGWAINLTSCSAFCPKHAEGRS